jgi:hypothetical protein
LKLNFEVLETVAKAASFTSLGASMKPMSVKSLLIAIALVALASSQALANTITPAYVVGSFIPGVSITYAADVESGEIYFDDSGFTIYDVQGAISATTSSGLWAITASATGTPFGPPPNPLTTPDNASVLNVHFEYMGPSFESLGSTPLGTFTIFLDASAQGLGFDDWASQDYTLGAVVGLDSTTKNFHNAALVVPTVPDGGSTAMLLGSVLVAFGALRRKFNG